MRVLIAGARFQGLDGVSLEAEKVAEGLGALGHEVFWLAGALEPWHRGAVVREMGLFDPEAKALAAEAFAGEGEDPALEARIEAAGERLYQKIADALSGWAFDAMVVENAWAIPMQLPLAVALVRLWRERGLLALSHNHDYYWERPRFLKHRIPRVLKRYFPPKGPVQLSLSHRAIRALFARRGLKSRYLPNVMPFERPLPPPDAYARSFRRAFGLEGKTLLLQPTRIVPRKRIERSLALASWLRRRGWDAALVISHPGADEGPDYPARIRARAEALGVPLYEIGARVGPRRDPERGIYALWDVYQNADLVTYPSAYEGFGNALLEAVYTQRPLWVGRYPVYLEEIKPLGFRFLEVEDPYERVEAVLADPERVRPDLVHNYRLAARHFGYRRLTATLREALREAGERTTA